MRVAVSGSRNAKEEHRSTVVETLEYVIVHYGIDALLHGGSKGVDQMVNSWGHIHDLPIEIYPALWQKYGRGAGPKRNELMLNQKVDYWVAFPMGASPGTRDFIKRAVWLRLPGQIINL